MTEAKKQARRDAFARRKTAHARLSSTPEAGLQALSQVLRDDPAEVIAAYLPIRTEIDPRPAMAALHAQGRRLCVPVIQGDGRPLIFREWTPGAALVEGPFGAAVPAKGDWLTPRTLIVPLVAFDDDLMRLGYGGGFYDRTLAGLPGARAFGFAFEAQRSETPLPREATDRVLHAVVTEAQVRVA